MVNISGPDMVFMGNREGVSVNGAQDFDSDLWKVMQVASAQDFQFLATLQLIRETVRLHETLRQRGGYRP